MASYGVDSVDSSSLQPVRRSDSVVSDAMSTSGASISIAHVVPPANPPPAYIAQHEASALISAELERQVTLTPAALGLLNDFLDHVLYNILVNARSVALGSLKAAVSIVLKPRLGKAALKVAEEELREYMEDGEEEDLLIAKPSPMPALEFDSELVWKLARLRCMVYARMGDLEEEDEEEWLEREDLLQQVTAARKSGKEDIEVGPAAAIFLTAIIEYVAEQALYYAAQHAQKRHDGLGRISALGPDHVPEVDSRDTDIALDGRDMNHLGRDSPLSRLWRTWRRDVRATERSTLVAIPEPAQTAPSRPIHNRTPSSTVVPSVAPIQEEGGPLPSHGQDLDLNGSKTPTSVLSPPLPVPVVPSPATGYPARAANRPASLPPTSPREVDANGMQLLGFQERSPLRPKWDRRSSSQPNSTATSPQFEVSSPFFAANPPSTLRVHRAVTSAPGEIDVSTIPGGLGNVPRIMPPTADDDGFTDGTVTESSAAQVGVHRVAPQGAIPTQPEDITQAPVHRSVASPDTATPVTGASISGPQDFDSMHIPTNFVSPESEPVMISQVPISTTTDIHATTNTVADSVTDLDSQVDNQAPTEPQDEYFVIPHGPPRPSTATNFSKPTVHHSTNSVSRDSTGPVYGSPSATRAEHDYILSPTNVPQQQVSPRLYDSFSRGHVRSESVVSTASSGLLGSSPEWHATANSSPRQNVPVRTSSRQAPNIPSFTSGQVQSQGEIQIVRGSPDTSRTQRDLEQLINGNETLRYTLTPPAAAYDPADAVLPPKRTGTQDLADFFRNTAPPDQEYIRPRTEGSARQAADTRLLSQSASNATSYTERASSSAGPRPDSTATKRRIGEPRDARVTRDYSTRELAEYMRSTGPTSESQLPKILDVARSLQQTTDEAHKPNGTIPIPRPESRIKYQARDARPSAHREADDLIDFIRAGPPGPVGADRGASSMSRVPGLSEKRSFNDGNSVRGGPSIETTASSQVPLLRNGNDSFASGRISVGPQLLPSALSSAAYTEDPSTPKRTRRGPRDPYAIDESEDELDAPVQRRRSNREQESLVDFLRNTAPTSPQRDPQSPPTALPIKPSTAVSDRAMSFQSRNLTARASSPHLTKTGSILDSFRPTTLTHASHVDRNRQKRKTVQYDNDGEGAPAPQISTYKAGAHMRIEKESTFKRLFGLGSRTR